MTVSQLRMRERGYGKYSQIKATKFSKCISSFIYNSGKEDLNLHDTAMALEIEYS
jgi:hypothetical protein